MIFWTFILTIFAFISYTIDAGYLPSNIFRNIWNICIILFALHMLYRIKSKQREGLMEILNRRVEELRQRYDNRKINTLAVRLNNLEERVLELEEKAEKR
ncbi:MAG: hypothetical protein ACLFQK_06210 [Fibrobacterota bacterium]